MISQTASEDSIAVEKSKSDPQMGDNAVEEDGAPVSKSLHQLNGMESANGTTEEEKLDLQGNEESAPAARMSPLQTVILTLALCVSHHNSLPTKTNEGPHSSVSFSRPLI